MPLWDTKQRQGSPLHRICAYQGCFPPQLPKYFLQKYPGEVVLDPFCGRGTVLLEATLQGRAPLGFDLLPTALALSRVKVGCDSLDTVLSEIERLDLSGVAPQQPVEFVDLYHPEVWSQLWNLRQAQRSTALTALTLGRLHGHSPGFFSDVTFNVVSLPPASIHKMRMKHGEGRPLPLRDVKSLLVRAAKRFIPKDGLQGRGSVERADARDLPLTAASVDLVITSPPFLDVIDYPNVNWVREWFLDGSSANSNTFSIGKVVDYKVFLRNTLVELRRVIKPKGTIVFEVGVVKRKEKMFEFVQEAAEGLFSEQSLEINTFDDSDVPKISRAMRGGNKTTTMSNQCVILRV